MRQWRIWPRAKGVHAMYLSRVLRLTLLAPEIVEAILDGRQPAELKLNDLLKGFPMEWAGQLRGLGQSDRPRVVDRNDKGSSNDAKLVRPEHCMRAY
jgi:hypothetical protein